MQLNEYFEKKTGRSVLATSDDKGIVNVAIYSHPYFLIDKVLPLIGDKE